MDEIIHWQTGLPPKRGHYLVIQQWLDDNLIQCTVEWFDGHWGWSQTPQYEVKYWAIRPKGPL
jgi:hypothetical protein